MRSRLTARNGRSCRHAVIGEHGQGLRIATSAISGCASEISTSTTRLTCAGLAQETFKHIPPSLTRRHHEHVVRGTQARSEAMASMASMPPWLSTAAHLDFSHLRPHSLKRALLFPFRGARSSTTPSEVRLNSTWSPHLAWPLPSAHVSHSHSLLRRRLVLLRPQFNGHYKHVDDTRTSSVGKWK